MSEPPPKERPGTVEYAPAPDGVTRTVPPAPREPSVGCPSVPGYEILGKLGEGGMGVVYQARQLEADRLVALKMILGGGHATADALARFRTEARAIARLQHPNVVQVYEVGEHAGVPFFSLEFCPGGSLDQKLAGTPLPPAEAAGLVEVLARAMHAAHQEGIVHRDLKPANVLLAADGTPKVTDFGLAKRVDAAAGPTATNAVLGTPSYVAPEQAGGKNAVVGPAADVYALGAILYECLTGRPPFKAATPLDTILQVVSDEPVPPTQLQSKTPRDLETICLKCLQKEAGQHYASAADLAEDLRRFQAGEPIWARPVGTTERLLKWVRRRPAVAALLAGMVLTLLLGTAVFTYFAIEARQQAKAATESADVARNKENEATDAREQAETILARSLLRPLGHNPQTLNDIELDALWELAESPSDRVRLLFVANALETEGKALQLANRAELALHATEGLDRQRRQQVGKMLLSRLQDDSTSLVVRSELALRIAQANPGSDLAGTAARQLGEALAKATNDSDRSVLARSLAAVAQRLGPEGAGAVARQLSEALAKENDADARSSLAADLAAVARRLGPEGAGAVARQLSEALAKATNPNNRSVLARGLMTEAQRIGPVAENPLMALLLRHGSTKMADSRVRQSLAESLAVVAVRLDPEEAALYTATAARQLSEALAKETDAEARFVLAQVLEAVAAWLLPEEAVKRSLLAARAIGEAPLPSFAGLAALTLAAQPVPSRIPTQELVDFLKWPTCVGSFRAIILHQLGGKYNRHFADQWEFVEYAQKHLPEIDLKSPPKRPEPVATVAKP